MDEGKFNQKNVELSGVPLSFYKDALQKRKVKSVRKVLVMTVDGEGNSYLQVRGKKYETFRLDLPEGVKW